MHVEIAEEARRSIPQSLEEYGRGIAGGLIFSLPLLYTMEVWWAGYLLHLDRLLLYMAVTFLLLLGYNHYAGMRRDASFTEVIIDSIEEMGLGMILAAFLLWLLGRVTAEMPVSVIMGKVVMEAMTVAIGFSVGTAQLGASGQSGQKGKDQGKEGDAQGSEGKEQNGEKKKEQGKESGGSQKQNEREDEKDQGQQGQAGSERDVGVLGRVVITLCGAVLFAANVAPTEEILMLATEVGSARLLGLGALSILLSAVILYFSSFIGAEDLVKSRSAWGITTGLALTYGISLFASAMILWFFGRFEGVSLYTMVAQTVVLGLAATLGASAGRLLLQA